MFSLSKVSSETFLLQVQPLKVIFFLALYRPISLALEYFDFISCMSYRALCHYPAHCSALSERSYHLVSVSDIILLFWYFREFVSMYIEYSPYWSSLVWTLLDTFMTFITFRIIFEFLFFRIPFRKIFFLYSSWVFTLKASAFIDLELILYFSWLPIT